MAKKPTNYDIITEWRSYPFVDILSTIYWNSWRLTHPLISKSEGLDSSVLDYDEVI